MTTLKVATQDQTLIAVEKVKIASGDIESVFLDVDVDEAWDEFTNRTASFYTSHDSRPHEVLLIDNHCTIPAEVLAKAGTLYVGIIGVTSDGSAVKTSSIVSYKISQGASHAYTTLNPELDAFQQYLAAMKGETAPSVVELKETIAKLKDENETNWAILESDVWAAIQPNLLWTNPSPTEDFVAQELALDLSEYKRFVVTCKRSSASTAPLFDTQITEKNAKYEIQLCLGTSSEYSRNVTFYDDRIAFDAALSSANSEYNEMLIPVKIYGFKY